MAVIAWGSGRGPNCRWDGVRGGTPAARLRHPGRAGKLATGERVKNALGTASSAFAAASPQQLIAAARLPNSGMSEIAVNASLAFIEGAKPKDEVECALVMQMACTHSAAMSVLGTFAGANGYGRTIPLKASAAAKLMRAYAAQVEALRRLRKGNSQTVRVVHVHVNEGGQAVIGNVNPNSGSGR